MTPSSTIILDTSHSYRPTIGLPALDIGTLAAKQGYFTYDPGFKNTCSCKSTICYIDGEQGILLYRGYRIEDLAASQPFEAVMHLLLYKKLPSARELSDFSKRITSLQATFPSLVATTLSQLPNTMHPMAILMTLMSVLSGTQTNQEPATSTEQLLAWMPILVSNTLRHVNCKPWMQPKNNLSYAQNFLYMLNGTLPGNQAVSVLDALLTLHADHEQNASTHCVRAVGSSKSNLYASIASGLASLWGPLHGGANEACLNMLRSIGSAAHIDKTLARAKDKNDDFRLMGFGHRVYKNYDPRAKIIRDIARDFIASQHTDHPDYPLFELAIQLEDKALQDSYFVDHKLYPNVDFYSGIVQHAIGIPSQGFTCIFALGRLIGWCSHYLEAQEQGLPIVRPRQIYNGPFATQIPKR
jgi:citrate synthase